MLYYAVYAQDCKAILPDTGEEKSPKAINNTQKYHMLSIISHARIVFQSSWAYFVEFALISFYRSPRDYQKILKNESFVLKNIDKFVVFFHDIIFYLFCK